MGQCLSSEEQGTDPVEKSEEEEEETVTAGYKKAKAKAITIPPMPIIENPSYFVIKLETTIHRKREIHTQKLQSFL